MGAPLATPEVVVEVSPVLELVLLELVVSEADVDVLVQVELLDWELLLVT